MHHQSQTNTETAAAMRCGVDKLVFQGVNRRVAVRRVARRTRIDRPQRVICWMGGVMWPTLCPHPVLSA